MKKKTRGTCLYINTATYDHSRVVMKNISIFKRSVYSNSNTVNSTPKQTPKTAKTDLLTLEINAAFWDVLAFFVLYPTSRDTTNQISQSRIINDYLRLDSGSWNKKTDRKWNRKWGVDPPVFYVIWTCKIRFWSNLDCMIDLFKLSICPTRSFSTTTFDSIMFEMKKKIAKRWQKWLKMRLFGQRDKQTRSEIRFSRYRIHGETWIC